MKATPAFSAALALVLAFAALSSVSCDNSPDTPPGNAGTATTDGPAQAPAARQAPDPDLPELEVEITGNDQMKFSVTEITALPGQKVTVTLVNIGSMPKISMGHNWVLVEKGTDIQKFLEASMVEMANDYIAPEVMPKVIAHTKLLGPGERDTVSFAAPREPGDYEYICSFPGHYAIGMKGILTVK